MTTRALGGRQVCPIGLGCMNVSWAYASPPPPAEDPGIPVPAPFDFDAGATLQAYHPAAGGHSEQTSTFHTYPTGDWATVRVPLPHGPGRDGLPLRLDPCNFPGTVELESLEIAGPGPGAPLWRADGAALATAVSVRGAKAGAGGSATGLGLEARGADPQLWLNAESIPHGLAGRTDLAVIVRLRTIPAGRRTPC